MAKWRFEFQTKRGIDWVTIELPRNIQLVADAKKWFSKNYKSELIRVIGTNSTSYFDAFMQEAS